MVAAGTGASTAEAPGAPPQVSQAGEQRVARVESLRALAALGVCAAHAWGLAHRYDPVAVTNDIWGRLMFGGGFGVFFFFELSG